MARNWDMAASGGLGSLIDAYYGGRDRANALEDRDRKWGMEKIQLTQKQKQLNPYRDVEYDENGIPTGVSIENEPYEKRDEASSAAAFPHLFSRKAAPGYKEPPAASDSEIDKSYEDMVRNWQARNSPSVDPGVVERQETIKNDTDALKGNRQPQSATIEPDHAIGYREYPPRGDGPATGVADTAPGDPKPLLKDHKLAAQSAQSAQKASQLPKKALSADEIATDILSEDSPLPKSKGPISAKTPPGGSPKFDLDGYKRAEFEAKNGVPTRLKKSAVEFPEQTITAGEDYMPAEESGPRMMPDYGTGRTPQQELDQEDERYNPTPEMRWEIAKAAASHQKDKARDFALSSLPASVLKELGLDPNDPALRTALPMEIGRELIQRSRANKEIHPAAYSIARRVRGGEIDLGQGLQELMESKGGPASREEVNFISGLDKQNSIDRRGDENRTHQDKMAFSRAAAQAATKFSKEYKAVFDKIGGIASARKLIATGDASVLGIAGRLLLKGVGEHAITDRDINAAAGDANFIEMARQQYNKIAADAKLDPENAGMITKANRAFFERVADVLSKAALKKFEEAAQLPIKELRLMAKTTGAMTPDQAEKLFREEFDIGAIRGGMEKTLNDTKDVPKKENVNPRLQQLEEKYKKTVKRIRTSKLSAAEKKEELSEAEMLINSARRNLGGKK